MPKESGATDRQSGGGQADAATAVVGGARTAPPGGGEATDRPAASTTAAGGVGPGVFPIVRGEVNVDGDETFPGVEFDPTRGEYFYDFHDEPKHTVIRGKTQHEVEDALRVIRRRLERLRRRREQEALCDT